MAEGSATKRLSKVARELGVGVSTIVDFLSSKGQEVDSNPNFKIDQTQYGLLVEEFQSDKAAQDKSREMNQSKAVVRETISLDDTTKKDSRKQSEQEEVLIKNIQNIATADRVIKPKIEEKKPKVVDKIDLDAINQSTRPVKKEKVEEKKEVVAATTTTSTTTPAPAPVAKETPVEEKKEVEAKAETPTTAATTAAAATEKPTETPEKKPEVVEEKKPERKETEIVKVNVAKLAGPTVVGKIELPKKPTPKPKPVASSSDSDLRPKKKKRKRIAPANDRPGTGNAGSGTGAAARGKKPVVRGKKQAKPELNEGAIQNQIRETLARLSGGGKSKGAKYRRAKRDAVSQQMAEEAQ